MTGAHDERLDRTFDPGLQVERTALAWRRATLALAVLSIAGARILSQLWGAWALLPGAAGLLAAVAFGFASDRRHREQHRRLVLADDERVPLPGAGILAALAAAVIALGVTALVFALAH